MSTSDSNIGELRASLVNDVKEINPNAFLVLPRVLRRVIRHELELAALARQIPHRKSYVTTGEKIASVVERDELGLQPAAAIPDELILLPKPDEKYWRFRTDGAIRRTTWRLLFHATVDAKLQEKRRTGELTEGMIRARIDSIGQVEFDEIVAVLKEEQFLTKLDDVEHAYLEFVAVFAEFHFFAPHWLPAYFPSLTELSAVLDIISQDVDVHTIKEETRLPGSLEPGELDPKLQTALADAEEKRKTKRKQHAADPKRYEQLMLKAERSLTRGNSVGAAILYSKAKMYSPAATSQDPEDGRIRAINSLVDRLQATLGFNDEEATAWRDAITISVDHSASGFWGADKKLLYDLQKVCVDHERGIYRVDVGKWIRSFGKQPIKRLLPNQREVLISKHLRSASRRLVTARLSGEERERFRALLHSAAHLAEKQLRKRLRPLIAETFEQVGLVPQNVPETIAWEKLVDEMCDCVVHKGYLTMGNVRDALSRSYLKLPDVEGAKELWTGDRLLRIDKQLDRTLDGVYHRAEFYLRWLQILSSLAFGTRVGRFVTQYIALPFGGAFVALEALHHVLELIVHFDEHAEHMWHLIFPWLILTLGGVLCGLIHVPSFRQMVKRFFQQTFRVINGLVMKFPRWVMEYPAIHDFFRRPDVIAVRRYLVWPLFVTVLLCYGIPALLGNSPVSLPMVLSVFLAMNLLLNSRTGRDCEEVASEWAAKQWHNVRVNIFVALFDAIMDAFKWMMEAIERFLYAVDEWLRFKDRETSMSLAIKAVLGVIWGIFAYIVRFCVTLLVEPQINPIKHFPVVTVSHKIILPLQPSLARLLTGPFDTVMANTIAAVVVTCIPGVFGFLVWELKSNWKLYEANRPEKLKPTIVGDHGENMLRLMKPGFHSGTLPKVFSKLRKEERKTIDGGRTMTKSRYLARLEHLEVALEHVIEREFIRLLKQSPNWTEQELRVGHIDLASNSIRIDIHLNGVDSPPMKIGFQEQTGWLMAGILVPGWLHTMNDHQRDDLIAAVAGFYKICGVELVREQIESCFRPRTLPYDIAEAGLVVWPDGEFKTVVHYNLSKRSTIRPSPRGIAREFGLPKLEPGRLIYSHTPILWSSWVKLWDSRRDGPDNPIVFTFPTHVLPAANETPSSNGMAASNEANSTEQT